MKFRTELDTNEFPYKLDYSSKSLFIGSCFTTNIGNNMKRYKFNVDLNPFGVIYNPASICQALSLLFNKKLFTEHDLFFQNELWYSYMHHSSFALQDKDETLRQINNRASISSEFLYNTQCLFITFGTAYAYKLKNTDKIVANCHKIPAVEFNRVLLSTKCIVDSFKELINKLFSNNKLKIIFSVSPIRHLKDGLHANQLSKSILLLSIDELVKLYPENCFYFPSYELLLDDLRDYRFYAEDMCHPSNQAVQYIWNKFSRSYISGDCESTMAQVESIQRACMHRPFNKLSINYKAFQQKIIDKIKVLQKQYPFMNFDAELKQLQ